jgi:hypothetical protein
VKEDGQEIEVEMAIIEEIKEDLEASKDDK